MQILGPVGSLSSPFPTTLSQPYTSDSKEWNATLPLYRHAWARPTRTRPAIAPRLKITSEEKFKIVKIKEHVVGLPFNDSSCSGFMRHTGMRIRGQDPGSVQTSPPFHVKRWRIDEFDAIHLEMPRRHYKARLPCASLLNHATLASVNWRPHPNLPIFFQSHCQSRSSLLSLPLLSLGRNQFPHSSHRPGSGGPKST